MWDEHYKASQNIPSLNSSSIALSVLKSSDVTHTDSVPLNSAAPCRGTKGNSQTRQSFSLKTDIIFFLTCTSALHRQQRRSADHDCPSVDLIWFGLGSKFMQICHQINITNPIILCLTHVFSRWISSYVVELVLNINNEKIGHAI